MMGPFRQLEVLVEDASTEAALTAILPHLTGKASFRIYPHNGKDALLARLASRLLGYAKWLPQDIGILILADVDQEDCRELKSRMISDVQSSQLENHVLIRLAVEELEAWFFGDWEAVREEYPGVSATIPRQAKYRNPDGIQGGTWESLERVMRRSGYYQGGLPKIEFARRVARRMVVERNQSKSFQVFCAGARRMTGNPIG